MIHTGDCVEVMAEMDADSIDAIVTDPPYGLAFMGKEWDRPGQTFLERKSVTASGGFDAIGGNHHPTSPEDVQRTALSEGRKMQQWHTRWATEALRVAKPGAYLLAFGGTRTVHRLTVALEDAGWVIRDLLVWAYAQGFPKSKSSLKPAWEPIVLARKPGPLRELDIDGCRLQTNGERMQTEWPNRTTPNSPHPMGSDGVLSEWEQPPGRWPANVVLTDPIFDGGWEGVVGGGETKSGSRNGTYSGSGSWSGQYGPVDRAIEGDTGTYSRFFLIPKASRKDREPAESNGERQNTHPTVKPTALMRHLVRLVTPEGGTVLDPFLGSGTTALAAEQEGFDWVGIEREPEYVKIAEQRLVKEGLGL